MPEWQADYNLPVINDEFGYEGDIEFEWGNLSAFELIHRAWSIVVGGGYVTHGETFYREDEVLWWAKGGKLYGQSPIRLKFLKDLQYEIGVVETQTEIVYGNPNEKPEENSEDQMPDYARAFMNSMNSLPEYERRLYKTQAVPGIIRNKDYRLQYLGRQCRCRMDIQLPDNGKYKIEAIDIWEMTRNTISAESAGNIMVKLPGKEGIAILVTRISGDSL
jgi:hypothetical protein